MGVVDSPFFNFPYKSSPHIQGKSGIPTILILLSMIVVGIRKFVVDCMAFYSHFDLHSQKYFLPQLQNQILERQIL